MSYLNFSWRKVVNDVSRHVIKFLLNVPSAVSSHSCWPAIRCKSQRALLQSLGDLGCDNTPFITVRLNLNYFSSIPAHAPSTVSPLVGKHEFLRSEVFFMAKAAMRRVFLMGMLALLTGKPTSKKGDSRLFNEPFSDYHLEGLLSKKCRVEL